ncbi:hypothetical protein ABTH45_19315, partial [Acinetobacter baumannii]
LPIVVIGLVVWSQLAQRADELSSVTFASALNQLSASLAPFASKLGVSIDLPSLWAEYGANATRQLGAQALKAAQSGAQDAASMGVGLICQF